MKLPVIRQFYQNQTPENLEKTLEVLESFCEFRGTSEEDLNVAGELLPTFAELWKFTPTYRTE
jgi:hypothetical protein